MKITVIGDIMIDNSMADTLNDYKANSKYQFDSMFENCQSYFDSSDFVIGNLETPISYDNSNLTDTQWQFCSPIEFAEAIKKMGVDLVSTANNHCMDRGITGLHNTIDALNKINLSHTGTFKTNKHELFIQEINGTKIAVLAYTYGTNAITNKNYLSWNTRKHINLLQAQEGTIDRIINKLPNNRLFRFFIRIYKKVSNMIMPFNQAKEWYEKRTFDLYRKHLIKKDIKHIKKKSDIVIALIHIGGQYNHEPNEYTKETIHWFNKKKVDIIVANHEHVVHSHLWNHNTKQFSAYAIGNFISGAGIYHQPYNRLCDYSIVINFYVSNTTKKLNKITFSVFKTLLSNDNKLTVYPVDVLLSVSQSNSEIIKEEALKVASTFSNRNYDEYEKEFLLYEFN